MTSIYDMRNGKWSDLQQECYERNCICRGCEYQEYNNGDCRIKYSLMEKIKIYGVGNGAKTKKWLQ